MRRLVYIIYIVSIVFVGTLLADFAYTNWVIHPAVESVKNFEESFRLPNPHFSYGLRPNFEGLGYSAGRPHHIATNDLGFRDETVRAVSRKSAKRRVVLIGDSFTEGVGLPWNDTFGGKIAQGCADLEVLNAGVASYSPSIYERKIIWLLDQGYEFERLIVYVDISDIHDEAIRRNESLSNKGPIRFDSAKGDTRTADSPATQGRGAPSAIRRNFFLTISAARAIRSLALRAYAGLGGDPTPWISLPYSIGLTRGDWTVKMDESIFQPIGFDKSVEIAMESMGRLHALVAARGIPMTVAVYPWPNQIAHGDLKSRHSLMWREWCANKCDGFIDSFPSIFDAARGAGPFWVEKLFLYGDIHYNAFGNEIIAADTVRYLRENARGACGRDVLRSTRNRN